MPVKAGFEHVHCVVPRIAAALGVHRQRGPEREQARENRAGESSAGTLDSLTVDKFSNSYPSLSDPKHSD